MTARSLVLKYLPTSIRNFVKEQRELYNWRKKDFCMPAPHAVKLQVLKRYSPSSVTWVETGTWRGDTTSELSKWAKIVHTIEPMENLAKAADERFSQTANVYVHHGSSEEKFPEIVKLLGGNVAFWLDGHFSAGNTFKGSLDTPIVEELETIKESIDQFGQVTVCVDDFRCFDPINQEFLDYPDRTFLVNWAVENGFTWTVEHDIFVAYK